MDGVRIIVMVRQHTYTGASSVCYCTAVDGVTC
jgi:hypothetical protein